MRILYAATDQDLSSLHGGTIHVRAVSMELVRHGHLLHLLIQKNPTTAFHLQGCTLHEIPVTNRYLLWTRGNHIQKLLDDLKPDVVMERYYNFAGEVLIRACSLGIPTLLEVNSPMIEYPGSIKSKVDFFLGGALKRRRNRIGESASVILSPMRNIVPEQFRNKTREIEWGVDINLFNPAPLANRSSLRAEFGLKEDELVFIHFGSLRKWHGLTKLLEAYDTASNQIKRPTRLIIIGPVSNGPQRQGVKFVGSVQHELIPAWLKASDCAVFPFDPAQHRYLELGFYWSPLKLFEAMAMALPILTLNQTRIVSLMGTNDPDFYYDGSTQNLSKQIIDAAANIELLKEKAKQFRHRAEKYFSWETHGEKLNELLVELVSKK